MSEPIEPLSPVVPLTLRTRDGVLYTRPLEVEAQLAALVALSPAQVVARMRGTRGFRTPGYVRDECLAYFAREWHRTGQNDGIAELLAELQQRVERRVRGGLGSLFAVEVREMATDRVTERLWSQLFDFTRSQGEFWQVAFGRALKFAINDARARLHGENTRAWATLRDTSGDGDDGYDPLAQQADDAPNAETVQIEDEVRREALAAITDPRHREAFILRHEEHWPIEGDTPQTISAYFGVTSRTIRNWLRTAYAQLRQWQEEQKDA